MNEPAVAVAVDVCWMARLHKRVRTLALASLFVGSFLGMPSAEAQSVDSTPPATAGLPVSFPDRVIAGVRVAANCPSIRDHRSGTGKRYSNAELKGDVETIRTYLRQHPSSVYGGFSYADDNFGTGDPIVAPADYRGVIMVGFTDDLDTQATALASVVEAADHLMVCRTTRNNAETVALQTEIKARFENDEFNGWNRFMDRVGIALAADRLDDAKRLYGELHEKGVFITLGRFSYPEKTLEALPEDDREPCQKLPDKGLTPPGKWSLPSATHLEPGHSIGTIDVDFDVSQRMMLTGERMHTYLLKPGTNQVVAMIYTRIAPADFVAGTYLSLELPFGLDACDPKVGWMVPSGRYDMVAEIGIRPTEAMNAKTTKSKKKGKPAPMSTGNTRFFLTPRFPVVVP